MASTQTTGVWFGNEDRPALGWLSRPSGRVSSSGILVLPPIGYPYWSAHRTLRVLSERLAEQGHVVLRVDYDGTGDSSGDQWDPDRVRAWRETVALAAEYLRSLGAASLTLIGARLGATFALLDASALASDRIVAWAPVVSGRRYAKELRLLSTEVPADQELPGMTGSRVIAGSVFAAETLEQIAGLSLDGLSEPPADKTLLIYGSAEGEKAEKLLREHGGELRAVQLSGSELALETPPEFAQVPQEIVDEICTWCGKAQSLQGTPSAQSSASVPWRGSQVREEIVELAPHGHIAIITTPEDGVVSGPTLAMLNPGSETHIGPGRAWVEMARDLALRGHRSVRVDFLGWGESPDAGRAPGRPYDPVCVQDALAIIDGLEEIGAGPVVLFGLCASAWTALRSALDAGPIGVIALNPQMYWKQGDPVDIDWIRIRERRSEEIDNVARGARWRLWSVLDMLGHRPRVARWLEDLADTGLPIELLFAEGDDGLIYLRQRAGRRLSRIQRQGLIAVSELPGVDHPLHRTWGRPQVVDAIHCALGRIHTNAEQNGSDRETDRSPAAIPMGARS